MTTLERQTEMAVLDLLTLEYIETDRDIIELKMMEIKFLDDIQDRRDHPNKPKSLRAEICEAFGIPEDILFRHIRKRKVLNARQVYVYMIMTTDIKNRRVIPIEEMTFRIPNAGMEERDSPSVVGRHVGFDHATMYHCCNATWNYYLTEEFYRTLIGRLRIELFNKTIVMPNIKIPVV
jgi:hypothetical protein